MVGKIISVILTGLVVGSSVAVLVQIFLYSINFLSNIFRTDFTDLVNQQHFSINELVIKIIFFFLIVPFLVGLLVGIIRNFTKGKRWHGPPDVILSVHKDDEELNVKSGFLTSIASILSISCGSSVGQYGPLVHFGGTIGAEIKKLFSYAPDYKILVSSGVASAISAGFGAPLAGLIYAREVVLRHQSLASFSPILLSSIISYFFTVEIFEYEPSLNIPSVTGNNAINVIVIILAGIFAGLLASLYSYLLTNKNLNFLNNVGSKSYLTPAYAGVICGIVAIKFPEVTGIGSQTINDLLNNKITLNLALIFLVLKLFLTTLCIRMGLVGGIFAPALFLGASLGVVTAGLGTLLSENVNPFLIILSSMAALGSCIIGGPIANVLIVFELTSNYQAALSAGVCIVVATIVSSQLIGQSTFDQLLNNRNIDITVGRDILFLQRKKIKEIVDKDFLKIDGNITVKEAIEMFKTFQCSEAYYVGLNDKLLGKLSLPKLLSYDDNLKIKDIKKTKFLKINDDEDLSETIQKCKDFVGESIPVVDNKGKIIGIFSENDLFVSYLEAEEFRANVETKS